LENRNVIVAPSLLAANFLQLDREIAMINESEAGWLHLDVMDGRFVPNISFGLPVISQVTKIVRDKVCDVHLMILEPEKYAEAFRDAGAHSLTVHAEACPHLHRNIQQIKDLGMKAGVALNPHTPINVLENVINDLDLVLIMSVNPGFGGQKFIPQTLSKIRKLRKMIDDADSDALIEIDGGVTLANAREIVAAGTDVLVAGNTVFSAPDPVKMISQLKYPWRE
jgi:ribulose-phosphate 3-epimerase